MKKLIASILIVLLMIPTVAFAESTHTLRELDLTASGHSDKTLENDGYTWDKENAVLTLQDISVGGDIILPKREHHQHPGYLLCGHYQQTQLCR